MSVGTQEVLFLFVAILLTLVSAWYMPAQRKWLWGIPVCIAIGIVVTPADVLSAFLVAAPILVGYTFWTWRRGAHASAERSLG